MLHEDDKPYRVSRETINRDLGSPLLLLAMLLCIGAVGFAFPGVKQLFDLEATNKFLVYLSLDYIDGSAQQSWLFVKRLVNVLALLVPLLTAVGLFLTVMAAFHRKEGQLPIWGLRYFSNMARGTRIVLYAVAAVLAVLFVFRAARYIILNGFQVGGFLFVFAMLMPECVFAAVVAVILYLTIRGINSVIHTVDTIQLNVLTGKSESYGLTVGAVWLVAMMGVASAVLIVISRGDRAAMICFGLSALGDFLLAAWLLLYRKKTGRRALEQFRKTNDIFS